MRPYAFKSSVLMVKNKIKILFLKFCEKNLTKNKNIEKILKIQLLMFRCLTRLEATRNAANKSHKAAWKINLRIKYCTLKGYHTKDKHLETTYGINLVFSNINGFLIALSVELSLIIFTPIKDIHLRTKELSLWLKPWFSKPSICATQCCAVNILN